MNGKGEEMQESDQEKIEWKTDLQAMLTDAKKVR